MDASTGTGQKVVLHVTPNSHPCMAVVSAAELKGIEFENVDWALGAERIENMERIFGEGNRTVPGMLIGDEKVHGSVAIMNRLEEMQPDPSVYPAEAAGAIREAEAWNDVEFQEVARRILFGGLHFRPEYSGTFYGAPPMDPAATDAAIKMLRQIWKYKGITAAQIAEDLAAMPASLDRIDAWIADGAMGGETPTAADLQIGATLRLMMTVKDLDPVFEGRRGKEIALRLYPEYPGEVPAGAFPAGWVPSV